MFVTPAGVRWISNSASGGRTPKAGGHFSVEEHTKPKSPIRWMKQLDVSSFFLHLRVTHPTEAFTERMTPFLSLKQPTHQVTPWRKQRSIPTECPINCCSSLPSKCFNLLLNYGHKNIKRSERTCVCWVPAISYSNQWHIAKWNPVYKSLLQHGNHLK